jgi:imidazolonepropionase-like amidohydrolase
LYRYGAAGENALASGPCRCCNTTIGRVCDGVDACREAVRDEVRKGAGHIKIMVRRGGEGRGGGVYIIIHVCGVFEK